MTQAAADPCRTPLLCSHSISRRLSTKLSLFTMLVLGLLCWATWMSVGMMIRERNAQDLAARCQLVDQILTLEASRGGEAAVLERIRSDAPMRGDARLQVWRADGSPLYADAENARMAASRHLQTHQITVQAPSLSGGALTVHYAVDFSRDAEMGRRWAWVLVGVIVLAGIVVALGVFWHVRRSLGPLKSLAEQTRRISAQHLHHRLALADPAEELLPWIDQFNALMERLERAYAQLEGFNADVAHELRTPLATLIGQTEVALSRERGVEALRETLMSNLEEMQRLAAMVNDMLFLASADRGASARRGAPVSLRGLAAQVCEFHEAPLEDARLTLRIEGDAHLPVDEPLFKRALSNLLGNAVRFADPGSTVLVRIEAAAASASDPGATSAVHVFVQNQGQVIEPQHLPSLFNRFFRADDSRNCPHEQHHGLGLAIVAAIARMHGGQPLAESGDGRTRVGFTLAGT